MSYKKIYTLNQCFLFIVNSFNYIFPKYSNNKKEKSDFNRIYNDSCCYRTFRINSLPQCLKITETILNIEIKN